MECRRCGKNMALVMHTDGWMQYVPAWMLGNKTIERKFKEYEEGMEAIFKSIMDVKDNATLKTLETSLHKLASKYIAWKRSYKKTDMAQEENQKKKEDEQKLKEKEEAMAKERQEHARLLEEQAKELQRQKEALDKREKSLKKREDTRKERKKPRK